MALKIRDIAVALKAKAYGDVDLMVTGMAEPSDAGRDDLALAMSKSYADSIPSGEARTALLGHDLDWQSFGLKAAILVRDHRLALSVVSELFAAEQRQESDIHPLACISEQAVIGDDVSVGAYTVIGHGVLIGQGSRIAANCTIEDNVSIGDHAVIHAGVRIGQRVSIGRRFIAQANAVIGSDGFSFAEHGSRIEDVRRTLKSVASDSHSRWSRIYSLGGVQIGDDVEIGACTAVDRGTVSATVIGDRTKLDNQVHIAHNVKIGRDCLICGQVGIAGSATIGDRVTLAGMTGVSDHVKIGDNVLAAGAAKIYSRVRSGVTVMGSPALEISKNMEIIRNLRRLSRLFKRVSVIEKRLKEEKNNPS